VCSSTARRAVLECVVTLLGLHIAAGFSPGAVAAEASLLLQMDWEPTYSEPFRFQAAARMPAFTLYSDGLVVYVHGKEGIVLCAKLSAAQADSVWRHVLGLGIERLESYESQEKAVSDSMSMIVFDASIGIIRQRRSSGELRTIKNYADFANEPEILSQVRTYLQDWHDPSATMYIPQQATLVIVGRWIDDKNWPAWPLQPGILTSAPWRPPSGGGTYWSSEKAYVVDGERYEVLAGFPRQGMGMQCFKYEGSSYSVIARPWLPGEDFSKAIGDQAPR